MCSQQAAYARVLLLRLGGDLPHQWTPEFPLAANEFGQLLRRHWSRFGTKVFELILKFRPRLRRAQVLMHLLHDRRRCPARCNELGPTTDSEAGDRFRCRWDIGKGAPARR